VQADLCTDVPSREVSAAVAEHVAMGCFDMSRDEWTRLLKIWQDGQDVCGILRGLDALGCCRLVGLQEQLGLAESEFEPLVVCLVRRWGTSTSRLLRAARWAVHEGSPGWEML
jgi:hypothetical protein